MQFADGTQLAFHDPGTRHREGDIRFKYLLRGEAGSPQNYELSVVRTQDRFFGPPHRHNFDQIRYVISGSFGQPGKLELHEGEVGYYPEGTPYQIDSGDTEILILQFGGASGNGFTHYDQLRSHYPILAQKGEFKDGIFRWHEPPAGAARQQDGYEALWELIHGRPLVYPKPRLRQPVLMNPQAFDWLPTGEPGVMHRELGRFNERGTGVSQTRIASGTQAVLDPQGTIRLVYVLEGQGFVDDHALVPGCAFEVTSAQRPTVRATQQLVLLDLWLPRFDPSSALQAARAEEAVA